MKRFTWLASAPGQVEPGDSRPDSPRLERKAFNIFTLQNSYLALMLYKRHLPPQFQRFVAMPFTGELQPMTIKWCTLANRCLLFQTLALSAFGLWPIWKKLSHRVPGGKRSEGSDMEFWRRVNSHPSAQIGLTLEENMDQVSAWTSHATKEVLWLVAHLGKLWPDVWHGQWEAQGSNQRWREQKQQQRKSHRKRLIIVGSLYISSFSPRKVYLSGWGSVVVKQVIGGLEGRSRYR